VEDQDEAVNRFWHELAEALINPQLKRRLAAGSLTIQINVRTKLQSVLGELFVILKPNARVLSR
jgi:hypothetical protein